MSTAKKTAEYVHRPRRWKFRPFDEGQIADIERECKVSSVVAHLLACRGLRRPDDCTRFLDNKLTNLRDPDALPGCADAADVIWKAIQSNQKIFVYGDYDADGMTSTAILLSALRRLNADVGYFVPNRLDDGYGLSDDAIERLAQRGCKLIISVDCGIASLGPAETAKRLGIDLVVTDHHQMGDTLPDAKAIVHPRLPGHEYPFGDLCGAGVAFKLAWRLFQLAGDTTSGAKVAAEYRPFLFQALGFAAIGTVADVVPLLDENRAIVAHGLTCLKETPSLGLSALMKITKLDDKPALSSEDIGFTLGPRLNAAGRLGQAQLGVELLTTDQPERAETLANYIHELNGNRDSIDRSIYRSANEMIAEHFDAEQDSAFVLADRGWHAGVIGIVAGRIAEKYHRPTILIALDQAGTKPGTGSARTIPGIDLYQGLSRCSELLETFGGHTAAAGLRIQEDQIDEFRQEFCDFVAETSAESQVEPEWEIDAETQLGQLTLGSMEQIEKMAPFGQGNHRPLLVATRVELSDPPKKMGGGDRHLSVQLEHHGTKMRGVAFGKGEWADAMSNTEGPIDVVFRPVINEFRGFRKVELHLVDWRSSPG